MIWKRNIAAAAACYTLHAPADVTNLVSEGIMEAYHL